MTGFFNRLKSLVTSTRPHRSRTNGRRLRSYRPCLEEVEGRVVPSSLSISNVSLPEGDSDDTGFEFEVVSDYDLRDFTWVTHEGTASYLEWDYYSTGGDFDDWYPVYSATLYVSVLGDVWPEGDETFYVNVSSNWLGVSAWGVGTILNDDGPVPPPPPTISISGVSVLEGNMDTAEAVFDVTLSAASEQPVSVNYSTADGTGTVADGDYQPASGTLNFAPGETQKTITVLVNGDRRGEPDETLFVSLDNPVNATVANWATAGFIQDDEPRISIGDVSLLEGNTGTRLAEFTVTLSTASDHAVTVDYTTADGSATAADNDYQAASGTVDFVPGEISKTISVVVNGDRRAEPTEGFYVNLSNAANALLADREAIGFIGDDEPRISISDVSKREGRKNRTQFAFTVTLSAAYDEAVSVSFRTIDGTAKAGEDYIAKTGTVTFNPGETTKTVVIDVIGDARREADETFNLELFGASNALLDDWWALGRILNDD